MSIKLTNTSKFLLRPLDILDIGEALTETSRLHKEFGFINAYLAENTHVNSVENPIYLVFKPEDSWRFLQFLEKEYEKGHLVDDYNIDEYTILVYEYPKQFVNDYHLVIKGEYSKVSEKFINKFPSNTANKYPSFAYMVYTKDPRMKAMWERDLDMDITDDIELWKKFDMNEETFTLENLKDA